MHSEKKIVLTGASSGLGLELARSLCQRGEKVYGCGRSTSKKIKTVSGFTYSQVDVRNEKQVQEWFKELKQEKSSLDVLINNAFIFGEKKRFEAISSKVWDGVLATNLQGLFNVTRCAIPALKSAKEPLIVNIGSIIGKYARPGWSTYSISKYAMEGMSTCLAQELQADGIKVVTVLPSRVETKLRADAYPSEDKCEGSSLNLVNFVNTIFWILENYNSLLSGATLNASDIKYIQ